MQFGENIKVDFREKILLVDEESKHLQPQAWKLFYALTERAFNSPRSTLIYDEIAVAVFDDIFWGEDRKQRLKNLRGQINKACNSEIVQTVSTGLRINPHGEGSMLCISPEYIQTQHDVIPHMLTKNNPFADEHSVIHRNAEINVICDQLSGGKTALLLSGFGGVGKTSIARVLFSRLSDNYDSVAWIEYHHNLLDSFLTSTDLFSDITDQDARWRAVSTLLRDDSSTKLLFIDNADIDEMQEQNPQKDVLLKEIAGWNKTTIVITSRLPEILGYWTHRIGLLGNEEAPEPCVDLFYFYYDSSEIHKPIEARQEIQTVYKLIRRAGFHTYAIELLARGAVYENSLCDYLKKIEEIGFQYPSLSVRTRRDEYPATAARQMQSLFNMRQRSKMEQQILWDFSVLPEGTSLSYDEVSEILKYSLNDLDSLSKEGWLRHRKGQGFDIHPLVKEVVHFGLNKGKAPFNTVAHLSNLVLSKKLISDQDEHIFALRKLTLIENAANYLSFKDASIAASFFYNLGILEYTKARRRLTAVKILTIALEIYLSLEQSNPGKYMEKIADVKYHRGYIKSTTNLFRSEAKIDLSEALELWREFGSDYQIAMAEDHLGYVLSDTPETYNTAQDMLNNALSLRKRFACECDDAQSKYDYSTTCDNLGFLLYKMGSFDQATELLKAALAIRENLYLTSSIYATDVAWTAFNLGKILCSQTECLIEAEKNLRRSLELRKKLDVERPGMYTTNVVFTLIALAKLICNDVTRMNEVQDFVDEALQLKESIDPEHMGFFHEEIDGDIDYLTQKISTYKNNDVELKI